MPVASAIKAASRAALAKENRPGERIPMTVAVDCRALHQQPHALGALERLAGLLVELEDEPPAATRGHLDRRSADLRRLALARQAQLLRCPAVDRRGDAAAHRAVRRAGHGHALASGELDRLDRGTAQAGREVAQRRRAAVAPGPTVSPGPTGAARAARTSG